MITKERLAITSEDEWRLAKLVALGADGMIPFTDEVLAENGLITITAGGYSIPTQAGCTYPLAIIPEVKPDLYASEAGLDSANAVWLFRGEVTLRQAVRYLKAAGYEIDGTEPPQSAYDCTGRWWTRRIQWGRVGGDLVITQKALCDV